MRRILRQSVLALSATVAMSLAQWPVAEPARARPPEPTARPAAETLSAAAPSAAASSLRWGLLGNSGAHLDDVRAAGITTRLFELDWAKYEPRRGAFDTGYVKLVRGRLQALRSAGYTVILGLGTQYQPGWLLALPRSRYVDQFGDAYKDRCRGCARANFVWNAKLRDLQARYIARAFKDFGTDFAAVRLGGGRLGELGYPTSRNNGHANVYWAFDRNAARTNPVPGWRPGERSRHGQARKFLNWYLDALVKYERWQIATVRRHYAGRLMLLLPSWGIRPTQVAAAINGNLRGSTSAEANGEI